MKVMPNNLQVASPEIRAPAQNQPHLKPASLRVPPGGGAGSVNPYQKETLREEVRREELNAQEILDAQELKLVLEEIKKRFDLFSKYLKIEIDEDLDIPVVKIMDQKTNEVIRQIPPEYLLKIMKNLDQLLGLMVNERV